MALKTKLSKVPKIRITSPDKSFPECCAKLTFVNKSFSQPQGGMALSVVNSSKMDLYLWIILLNYTCLVNTFSMNDLCWTQ